MIALTAYEPHFPQNLSSTGRGPYVERQAHQFSAHRAPKFGEIEVQHSLGATIDTGVWLHGFILDGLQAGKFAGSTAAAKSALCEALLHTFAVPELVAIVEGHFEQVYGCNPLTFLGRIKACREKADRR